MGVDGGGCLEAAVMPLPVAFFSIALFGILGALLGALAGDRDGRAAARREIQQEAIERGFARYNAKTGAWEWAQPINEGERDA
jgi:hypothetical protein